MNDIRDTLTIRVQVNMEELDLAIHKLEKLVGLLEKAGSLAGDPARETDAVVTLLEEKLRSLVR